MFLEQDVSKPSVSNFVQCDVRAKLQIPLTPRFTPPPPSLFSFPVNKKEKVLKL